MLLADPRALLLIRWFDEMNASGKVLPGYQNKSCKHYHLPLHSVPTHAFEWISSYQVLCKVLLTKHKTKRRVHNMPAPHHRRAQELFNAEIDSSDTHHVATDHI